MNAAKTTATLINAAIVLNAWATLADAKTQPNAASLAEGRALAAKLRALAEDARPRRAPSRPARWADACNRAEAALSDLEELRVEYEEWRDNMPENLLESALSEKLGEVADLDIQGALDTAQEASGADLPRGFGKD